MEPAQILPPNHPSIGTRRAVFQFAIGQTILSVEATNQWAVLCMERLLAVDGKVSDHCEALSVVRDYRNLEARSERVQDVPFVAFMTDIVDPGRITDDVVVMEAFRRAMTPEEIRWAMGRFRPAPEPEGPTDLDDDEDEVPAPPVPNGQADRLTSALVGLGFKKAEVRQFVVSLGGEVNSKDMHSLIREGLRALAA